MNFKEYRPRGGWWKYYRLQEKLKTLEITAMLFIVYAMFATIIYYI